MKVKIVVGLLVILILGFTVFGEHGLFNLVRVRKQAEVLQAEAQRLRDENARIADEIKRLQTDRAYIERLAREELGMVRPGELVFLFAENPEQKRQR